MVYDLVRGVSAFVDQDRDLEDDIGRVLELVREGQITAAVADVWES